MRDAQAKELALMYEESLTSRSDQEYAMAVLKLENQRLKDEIAAYSVVRKSTSLVSSASDFILAPLQRGVRSDPNSFPICARTVPGAEH